MLTLCALWVTLRPHSINMDDDGEADARDANDGRQADGRTQDDDRGDMADFLRSICDAGLVWTGNVFSTVLHDCDAA